MRFRVSTLFGLLLPLAACAHAETAADRHFAELNDAVGKMQAEQDQSDHMGVVDPPAPEKAERPSGTARAGATPRSVSIGEDASRESDDPNDPSERPEIRLQGAGGPSARPLRSKTARSGRGEARIEAVDDGPAQDGAARASVLDPDAKKAYESALALATGRQYDRALEALTAFIVKYPDHPYVENALYWRGECYFARGEFLRAAEQFEAVLARFGGGKKAADALLKIGVSHERLGSPERAREYWDRLKRDYPRSDAARKIPQSNESSAKSPDRGAGPKENR